MPRFYIEIPDPPYEEAMRRALAQRRSTREQIAYDIERLYVPAEKQPNPGTEHRPEPAR